MSPYIRYPLVLGLVTALSGLALYATFKGTAEARREQDEASRARSLASVFVDGYGKAESATLNGNPLMKVWTDASGTGEPDYYALEGEGLGYNSGVPIRLMVGFTNPRKEPRPFPEKDGPVLVGWSVTRSEETPGLGEKIKDRAAPYTLLGKVSGKPDAPPESDPRTAFQKQFHDPDAGAVYTADEVSTSKAGGPIDVITGATYTTNGVVEAIHDAAGRLETVLE
jgi:Na+-translocating ferredoxin:NAD+ oxidoreductase RnfG subunit